MMLRNFGVAFAIVSITFLGLKAVPVSALIAAPYTGDVQTQIQRLMAQISELTAQLNRLRTQVAQEDRPTVSPPSYPDRHRICKILSRNLSQGAQGDDVSGLQEFLQGEGFFSGNATGYFGPVTAQAVARWQAQEGVSAIGSFGPLSRERIKRWCGGGIEVPGQRFSASPTRGDAPLSVTFNTWISGFRLNTTSFVIDFGDGTSERAADCSAPADACTGPGQNKHAYSQNGTYIAKLTKVTDPCPDDGDPNTPRCLAAMQSEVVGRVQIQVGPIACTKEYRPVCGSKPIVCVTTPCNPIPTTYGNRCEMNADGASFLYEGQCRSENPADDPQCKAWFDGCNSCSRSEPGGIAACTLRYCAPESMQRAYCTARFGNFGSRPPTISGFSGPTTLAEDVSGTWTINASDPEGGSLSYQVWWGDENIYAADMTTTASAREFTQSTSFTHTYSNAGTYTITITVRDQSGEEARTTTTVRVTGSYTACTAEYAPVCGRPPGCANTCTGTVCPAICQLHSPQTYSNRCSMNAAGASFLYEGQCGNQSATCSSDVAAANDHASGQVCGQGGPQLRCPYDSTVTMWSSNTCVTGYLQSRGWTTVN